MTNKKTKADLLKEILKDDPSWVPPIIEIHPANNELIQTPFSAVQRKPINWLWDGRIARGKVTIFAGEPGKGKSQLLLWLASMVSNGDCMPVDKNVFPKGKVAILSAEDDDDDTILPRLQALGANIAAIFQFKSSPRIGNDGVLQDDMVRLDRDFQLLDNTFANNPGYVLLIIDPITAYIGDINDYRNSEVRALIKKLSSIGKKYNIAIILNTHLAKPPGNGLTASAMNRVIGSIAYVAAARAAYIICDKSDQERDVKQFIPMKNNIGDDKTGFEYKIVSKMVDDIKTSRIEWLQNTITVSANEALTQGASPPKLNEAEQFVKDKLLSGSQLLRDIRGQADAQGISPNRLYAAKESLGVIEDYTLDRPRLTIWTLKS